MTLPCTPWVVPERTLMPRGRARGSGDLHDWLNATATELLVTAVALKWRLVQLEWLDKADLLKIHDSRLTANGRPRQPLPPPRLSNVEFVQRLHEALAKGDLSVRRAVSVMALTTEDLADLFKDYGLPVPFDL